MHIRVEQVFAEGEGHFESPRTASKLERAEQVKAKVKENRLRLANQVPRKYIRFVESLECKGGSEYP